MSDPREVLADATLRFDIATKQPRRDYIWNSHRDVPRLVAALTAVLDLHIPIEDRTAGSAPLLWCQECTHGHPCETVRAITEALEGGSS